MSMKERFIDLQNGSRLEVKINFATLYYMQEIGANDLAKKIDKLQKQKKKVSDNDSMRIAAKIIYAVLRSNGRKVTFDEALMLMPMDMEEIKKLMEIYTEEMEKVRKKQEARKNMKRMAQKSTGQN